MFINIIIIIIIAIIITIITITIIITIIITIVITTLSQIICVTVFLRPSNKVVVPTHKCFVVKPPPTATKFQIVNLTA